MKWDLDKDWARVFIAYRYVLLAGFVILLVALGFLDVPVLRAIVDSFVGLLVVLKGA